MSNKSVVSDLGHYLINFIEIFPENETEWKTNLKTLDHLWQSLLHWILSAKNPNCTVLGTKETNEEKKNRWIIESHFIYSILKGSTGIKINACIHTVHMNVHWLCDVLVHCLDKLRSLKWHSRRVERKKRTHTPTKKRTHLWKSPTEENGRGAKE